MIKGLINWEERNQAKRGGLAFSSQFYLEDN